MPADGTVTAKFHGGKMRGAPTFVVIHDAETPLADGYVQSIAGYFQRGPAAGTSAHHMIGPRTWLQLLPEDVVAYAAGAKANPRGIHVEQTGYARFTRTQWTTADGMAQLANVADCAREACDRWGIPKRWATAAQLRAAAAGQAGAGGLVYHDHVSKWLGGTTHHDPTPGYPGDLLLAAVLAGDGGDMAELTGRSLELLADVQKRVRGFDPNADMLQMTRRSVEATEKMLAGPDPTGKGDRLSHLWNQGAAILTVAQGLQTQVQSLDTKLDQVLAQLSRPPA